MSDESKPQLLYCSACDAPHNVRKRDGTRGDRCDYLDQGCQGVLVSKRATNAYLPGVVLAIDPGPVKSAWVLWDGKRLVEHAYGVNFVALSMALGARASGAVHFAVEMPTAQRRASNKLYQTAFWVGRFVEAFGGAFSLIGRHTVKSHLCGMQNVGNGQINEVLYETIGPKGTKKEPGPLFGTNVHERQALAVAVTWWETMREEAE